METLSYCQLMQRCGELEAHLADVVAENAALKSSILNTQGAIELACAAVNDDRRGDVFRDILNAIYVKTASETPATDAFLAEVRASGVTEYSSKRGFSFQHGSIHAHFGNGDVMVGSVLFDNGDAGINFAPVREKTGGVGTHYEWTKGKTAEQVDSVFVIASSNAEGLEVIRDKLSDAIAQLRQGGAA
jgi:hypothetical protein